MSLQEMYLDCRAEGDLSLMRRSRCLLRQAMAHFLRLNIVKKLLLGFLPLIFLLLAFAALALFSLNILHTHSEAIIHTDIPIQDGAEEMVALVLDQERFAKRYALLPAGEILQLFESSSEKIQDIMTSLANLPGDRALPLTALARRQSNYHDFLWQTFIEDSGQQLDKFREAALERELETLQEELMVILASLKEAAWIDQRQKTSSSAAMGRIAFKIAATICGVGLLLSLGAAYLVTRNISTTIRKLVQATEQISQGDFDCELDISNSDEMGDLALAFKEMGQRLKHLEKSYKDASPLTGLPGGIAIERKMRNVLEDGGFFAFCMFDIDHFKAFNDRYGYSRGNQVIKSTAQIIEQVAEGVVDREETFVGHIGGDDFVLITRSSTYTDICGEITHRFDNIIPSYYGAEDRKLGHIVGKDRQGNLSRFPLAGLSVAVVTNKKRQINSYIQVGEIAAELKKAAKSRGGSIIIEDKRSSG